MPGKPSVASPVIATNVLYVAGARIGDPTKIAHGTPADGWTPGAVDVAEFYNYYVNEFGQWVTDWVAQGTPNADLDTHIVETDANGLSSIAAVDVGGTSSVTTSLGAALTVTANTGAGAGSRAALVTAATGQALSVNNSSTTQPALYVSNDFGAATGLVFQCQILDGGKIAEFQALTDPADGIDVDALGTGKYGARVRAADDGAPILILDRNGAGTPIRGAISLPERARASAPLNGDLWKTPGATGFSRGFLEWEDDGGSSSLTKGTQRAWSSVGGLGYAHAESTGDTTDSTGVFVTKVTLTMDGTTATEPDGDYIVEWSALVRPFNGAIPDVEVKLTGPGGFSATLHMVSPLNNVRVPVSFKKKFTFAGGPDTWTLEFQTETGGQDVIISEASITCKGAYE